MSIEENKLNRTSSTSTVVASRTECTSCTIEQSDTAVRNLTHRERKRESYKERRTVTLPDERMNDYTTTNEMLLINY
jgi:hypothetical protein